MAVNFIRYDYYHNPGVTYTTFEAAHENIGSHLRPKSSKTYHTRPGEKSVYQDGDLVHDFGQPGVIVEREVQ